VQTQTDVIEPGEELPARVMVTGDPPAGATLTLDALDCYDRLFWSKQIPAAPAATFTVASTGMCGRSGGCARGCSAGGQLLDSTESEFSCASRWARNYQPALGAPGDWRE